VWPVSSEKRIPQEKTLDGQRFVITGTLDDFTRDGIRIYIRQFGGKVSDTISSKTDYLILGKNPGSKFEKAKKLGITVINEKKLREMTAAES